jgi:hypothetical protein
MNFPPSHIELVRGCTVAFALCCCVGTARALDAQAAHAPGVPAIRAVDVVMAAGEQGAQVTIHADGPLPAPVVGTLDAPARIYLDFAGVAVVPGVAGTSDVAGVRGIRVGQHGVAPLVARVVIDLVDATGHSVDATGRQTGTVLVRLWALRPPEKSSPSKSLPGPRERGKAYDRYMSQVSPALARLQAVSPVIASVDARGSIAAADLTTAAAELENLALVFGALTPPAALATTHEILIRTCALGARAARMRYDADRTADTSGALNAASAAAGAMLLFDRATRELGPLSPH